jgi:hypothetical protein
LRDPEPLKTAGSGGRWRHPFFDGAGRQTFSPTRTSTDARSRRFQVGVYKETLSGIRKARGKQPLERARVMALVQPQGIDAVLVTELTR